MRENSFVWAAMSGRGQGRLCRPGDQHVRSYPSFGSARTKPTTPALGHELPPRLPSTHDRCTPDSRRLAARPKSAEVGQKRTSSLDRSRIHPRRVSDAMRASVCAISHSLRRKLW